MHPKFLKTISLLYSELILKWWISILKLKYLRAGPRENMEGGNRNMAWANNAQITDMAQTWRNAE